MILSQEERQILEEFQRRGLSLTRSNRWCPQDPTPKQQEFLDAKEFEVLYGGALGGAKTSAILMAALQYVDQPGYSALLVRKTYPDLAQPGGLIPRSHEWLQGTAASYNEQRKQWRFPSGATLQFGYLDGPNDQYRYNGSEFQFIGVDEAGHIPITQLTYLITRLRRSRTSEIPLRFRLTANPGGVSHEQLKSRYIDSTHTERRFIPSRLTDNPHLDQESYVKQLQELDPFQRAQLLDGDWDAVRTGVFCNPTDFKITESTPDFGRYFRCWDIGLTPNGDYTVGVLMARSANHFYVLDVKRVRLESPSLKTLILQTAEQDPANTLIGVESSTASLSIIQDLKTNRKLQVLPDIGFNTNQVAVPYTQYPPLLPVKLSGQNKLQRISGFLARIADKEVMLKKAEWNSAFINEFCSFTAHPSNVDDQIDATSIGFLLCMKTLGSVIENDEVPYKSPEWYDRLREDIKERKDDLY